jgi:hypothetical protein
MCAFCQRPTSFGHLVGADQHRLRHRDAELPRGVQVDHELDRARLLDRQLKTRVRRFTGSRAPFVRIELEPGLATWFLEPNDAAVSKYARMEPRDCEWIRAGLQAHILSLPILDARFAQTAFLDPAESARARSALGEDRAWRRRDGGLAGLIESPGRRGQAPRAGSRRRAASRSSGSPRG